eukprot:GEMP01007974.1.p1 GENE.GEMP01007974.1~~GEMP01007974.1.p1  ORF type:complete len:777 (+),score=173.85 GEMP01007974.1:26-2332(+)
MVFDTQTQTEAVCALISRRLDGKKRVGFAVFDEENRLLKAIDYVDNDHFSCTEAALLQVRPSTLYTFLPEPGDAKKIKNIALGCGIEYEHAIKGNDFNHIDVAMDLPRMLKDDVRNHVALTSQEYAMRALAGLMNRFRVLSKTTLFKRMSLLPYPVNQFARLDKAAFSALHILPRPEEGVRSPTSILGLLNRCRTAIGARKLTQWLTQPLMERAAISSRHDVVELLTDNSELLRKVQSAMRHVPDFEKLTAKFHKTHVGASGGASLDDAHCIFRAICASKGLLSVLETFDGVHKETLLRDVTGPLRKSLEQFVGFTQLIETSLDLEEAEKGNYLIDRSFDPSFAELAKTKDDLRAGLDAEVQRLNHTLGLGPNQVRLQEVAQGTNWALRVIKRHQNAVQKQDVRIISVKKNEFIFTTTKLDQLAQKLNVAGVAYEKAQAVLVETCLKVASSYTPVMENFGSLMASLDVLCAFAVVATGSQTGYVRPIHGDDAILIRDGTHPLVVESGKNFIPNDVEMTRETSRMQIITGPNMGGKSTYMRQVAITCLLNQIGMFVPAKRAMLPIVSAIMCRVGASDMQLKGISTFMAEMIETACILRTCDRNALVIVDELGRGTSTEDGFGLAWSVAKHLAAESQCFTLFATHFHELGALQQDQPGVVNRHASAMVNPHDNKLTFMYEMKPGVADRSYGCYVAEIAKFPASTVESAKRTAEQLEERVASKKIRVDSCGPVLQAFQCSDAMEFAQKHLLGTRSEEDAAAMARRLCSILA